MDIKEKIRLNLTEYSENNNFDDDPRSAIKSIKDYPELIEKLKNIKDINIIRDLIEKWILKYESHLSKLVCGRYISCEHAAEAVGQILSDARISHKMQVGTINGQSHAWVKVNNIIIDPTKSQFPNIQPNDYNQDIYWEQNFDFPKSNLKEDIRDNQVRKIKSFQTEEGKFSVYDIEDSPKSRPYMFTVFEDKNGWIVRNASIPDEPQKQGIGTKFYIRINAESLKRTGKPLRSTPQRKLLNGKIVHELSPAAISLWDGLVRNGYAEKLSDKNYVFKSK